MKMRNARGAIVLLAAALTLAWAAAASAATVIHFQSESDVRADGAAAPSRSPRADLPPDARTGARARVAERREALHRRLPAAAEEAKFVALARADGTPVAVAVAKPKAAAKPAHHTLRYVAAGILVLVIVVVAAVLLVDRRRKLNEEGGGTPPPTQSQPSQ